MSSYLVKNIMKPKSGIERLQKLRRIPDLDKYLIFSFTVLIIYTVAEFIVSTITTNSHDTLTTCLYAAFGGETLLCALIKKYKLKRGE